MMVRHKAFPLAFVATGKHLLLAGGGALGEQRLEMALRFDWARITMITDSIPDSLRALADSDGRVTLHQRAPTEADVEAADIVIENTTDRTLAAQLAQWCRPRKIPLNAMDKLEFCDVYYPALILRGSLIIAITSSGDAPALTSTLRKLLEARIGPGWCNAALLLSDLRRQLPKSQARMDLLKSLAQDERLLDYIGENNMEGMRKLIEDAVRRLPTGH